VIAGAKIDIFLELPTSFVFFLQFIR